MVKPVRKGFFVPCPHCDSASHSVKLQHVSATTMSLGYCCSNAACGHRFVAVAEAVRTLSPPASPRPGVRLALDARIDRTGLAEVLRTLPTAERLASPSEAPQGTGHQAAPAASSTPLADGFAVATPADDARSTASPILA